MSTGTGEPRSDAGAPGATDGGEVARPDLALGERFEIARKLGEGGMGVVYEALDRERGEVVALKTMSRVDASLIYQFKQEFRALADVVHPNLVGLHELLSAGDKWLFTMEIVDGTSFLAYLRDSSSTTADESAPTIVSAPVAPTLAQSVSTSDATLANVDAPPANLPASPPRVAFRLPLNMERLRSALGQLADGLGALHAAGKLHRDIKPSNVLVAKDGRVVVLDFGLVTDLAPHRARAAEDRIAGTPAYMAPEHIAGVPLTTASDWYSVGAMLYEVITGMPPFMDGRMMSWEHLLRLKQLFDPPPPWEIAPHVERELSNLCVGLLRREPTERLGAADVRRYLEGEPARLGAQASEETPAPSVRLIGREAHLATLERALARTRSRRAVSVHVHGVSGMGKTAVVRRFLDGLLARGEGVVLEGRCYERESVPYKALDSLVDALSLYLAELPLASATFLLPRHVDALARIFPVLSRVPAVATSPRPVLEMPDPQELRRTAFAALRELFGRMSEKGPLVLSIDDLQWGDLDSAALLEGLVSPPDAPALLLIASYRDGDPATEYARSLLPRPEGAGGDVVDLEVGPLATDDARKLALTDLGRSDPAALAVADAIAREAAGNPFFLHEFVRYAEETWTESARAGSATAIAPGVSFDDLLASRLGRLPRDAQRLLDVIAVAGRPLAAGLARRAAEVAADDHAALAALRAAHMVRLRSARGQDEVEAYHDRIREGVVRRMPAAELRFQHRRLAELFEEALADPEALAEHWKGAGEPERAADHAVVAAGQAAKALAFDRAAKLYRLALELLPEGDARRGEMRARLGDALANGGRCVEAASAFLEAAPAATAGEALDMRRRAAEQLLISGHIDEGLDVLRTVLGAVRLTFPGTPAWALVKLLLGRAWLRIRGLGTRERDVSSIPKEEITRIDVCWAATVGLGMVDNVRGAYFQTQHILLALRAGEPYRVARALAMEVAYRSTAGREGRRRALALSRVAIALAERIGHPHTLGLTTVTAGMTSFLQGDWTGGYELIARGEEILREQCSGVVSERTNAVLYALRCLLYLGKLREVCRRLVPLIAEAEERGDLHATTYLRLRYAYLDDLTADNPAGAERMVSEAASAWSRRGFFIQHYLEVFARAEIDLYLGNGASAYALLEARMPQIKRAMLMRVQHLRIEMLYLHGRAALSAAAGEKDAGAQRSLVRVAERDARRLSREKVGWGEALGHAIAAGVALARGDREKALLRAHRAEGGFGTTGMVLHAACIRRLRGELSGGSGGAALMAEADKVLFAERISNPARWTAMMVGGPKVEALPALPPAAE